VPLSQVVARWRHVTPNRVTLFSALLALAAVVCFATGHLRVGGVLFILRYFVDCMDGQVARFQGTSSKTGAALDITVDVLGISASFAAICWHLVRRSELGLGIALTILAVLVVYNWSLTYRKGVAAAEVEGDGGTGGQLQVSVPGLGPWLRFCRRIGMSPLPWSVEAEIVALGLGPLILPARYVFVGLLVTLVFYVFASLVNLRRIRQLTRALDAAAPTVSDPRG
jgi:phosphatidylglycerophosphate synthase